MGSAAWRGGCCDLDRAGRKHMGLRASWRNLRSASRITADTAVTAATNSVLAALGMVSGILAARLLGPHGRGELAAIQTWPGFMANLAMLGMPEALVYFSARRPEQAGRYLSTAIVLVLISSMPFIAAGYWLMPWMLHSQTESIVSAGRWYLVCFVVISAIVGMLLHPLRGAGDFILWNAMRLGPGVLWIGVLLVAWLCARTTPRFVAAGNLVTLALLFFPFALVLANRVQGSLVPEVRNLPAMLRYGFPCMMTTMPYLLNVRLDQMLMAALLPARELGLYVVAVAWSGSVGPILNAVAAVTLPAVAAANDRAESARQLAVRTRIAIGVGSISCVMVAMTAPLAILLLFGHRFANSIPAALVLVPAATLLGFNLVLHEGLRGLGRPYAPLQAELVGLAVTAMALVVMLRPLGIMGAAISSLLGYGSVTAALLFHSLRITRLPLAAFVLPRPEEFRLARKHLASLFGGLLLPGRSVRWSGN